MELQVSVDIGAPPPHVWAIMADVERWHEWTASISSIRRLEPGPLAVGSTAGVKQPRVPAVVWRVTSLTPGEGFVWEARAMGTRTIGGHEIEPQGSGGSRVKLTIQQTGGIMLVLAPLTSRMTRRYLEMETAGLKARAEGVRF